MKEIGGYFELELKRGAELHKKAIRLNSGHAALEYILGAKKIKKVWLPYYTCHIMADAAHKAGVQPLFYHIDKSFNPVFDFSTFMPDEGFVFTNYFGICDYQVKRVLDLCPRLIIDNAQAFYSKPLGGADTFYSPRKFFGVPDGGYLYTDTALSLKLRKDKSMDRFEHLLGRIEHNPGKYLEKFRNNDSHLGDQPTKQMSAITRRLLESIDYANVAVIRRKNFEFLHRHLKATNEIEIDISNDCVPMIYPYYTERKGLKELMLRKKIYIASYWPEVLESCEKYSVEYNLAKNILPLPIDQRYSVGDMRRIIESIGQI